MGGIDAQSQADGPTALHRGFGVAASEGLHEVPGEAQREFVGEVQVVDDDDTPGQRRQPSKKRRRRGQEAQPFALGLKGLGGAGPHGGVAGLQTGQVARQHPGVLLDELVADGLEARVHPWIEFLNLGRHFLGVMIGVANAIFTVKWMTPRQHLIEDDAQAVEVSAAVDLAAQGLLR